MNNKIKLIVERYIGEIDEKAVSRKEYERKLEKVINSLNNAKQVEVAAQMIYNYLDMYGKSAINKLKDFFDPDMYLHVSDPKELKWFDKLHFKLKKMESSGQIPKGSIDDIFRDAVGVTPSKKEYIAKYIKRNR